MKPAFHHFCLVGLLAFVTPLFAFMGRMPPDPEVRRVEARDRGDRILAFLSLSNESPGQLDFLSSDLPKTMALSLAEPRLVVVTPDDLDPSFSGLDAYEHLLFPMQTNGAYLTQSSNSEGPIYLTNVPTHPRFAFMVTQGQTVHAYLCRPMMRTVDPMRSDFSVQSILPGQIVVTQGSRADLPGRYLLVDATNHQRLLKVSPDLWLGDARTPASWFEKAKADYLVVGSYRDSGDNQVRLRLWLLSKKDGAGKLFYNGTLPTDRIMEESASLAPLLLARLQNLPVVESVSFQTTPAGAHVSLAGVYLGTTPFVSAALPAGEGNFTWWHPAAKFVPGRRPTGAGEVRAALTNGWTLALRPEDKGTTNALALNPVGGTGVIQISLGSNKGAHLWVDGNLVASGEPAQEVRLSPGEHLVSSQLFNGGPTRRFRIPVMPQQATLLEFNPGVAQNRKILPGRELTVFFGTLSLVGAIGTVYSVVRRGEFSDRAAISSLQGLATYSNETAAYQAWNTSAMAFAYSTGAALLATLGFRILDIHQSEIRLETRYQHGPDVRLQFKREF